MVAADEPTRHSYHEFLRLLPEVLPCAACRRHCAAYLARSPPEESPDLRAWLADFRKDVEERVQQERAQSRTRTVLVALACILLAALMAAALVSAAQSSFSHKGDL